MPSLSFQINEKLFLRDPQQTPLGRRIIRQGVALIGQLGFEAFTFRKLAEEISSTEASVYRYFESKHRMLQYLANWYWSWVAYRMELAAAKGRNPEESLRLAIALLTEKKISDPQFSLLDAAVLHQVVVNEFEKTFLTHSVDRDHNEGAFEGFQGTCTQLAELIRRVNAGYTYHHALASSIVMLALRQPYFFRHIQEVSSAGSDLFIQSLVMAAISRRQSTSITSPLEAPSTDFT